MEKKSAQSDKQVDDLLKGVEYRKINLLQNIQLPEELKKSDHSCTKIIKTFSDAVVPLNVVYPPIFTEQGVLIGRYWSFLSALSSRQFDIIGMVIPADLIDVFVKFDQQELLKFSRTALATPNRSTRRRKELRSAGAVCPFCKSPVRVYQAEGNRDAGKGVYAHCERNISKKESKNYGKCDYRIKLTPYEHERFKAGEMRISEMMERIPSKCKNGKQLYQRTIHWGDRIEVVERCRDYFSSSGQCDCKHYKEVSEKQDPEPMTSEAKNT